jgi:hypothetical protein
VLKTNGHDFVWVRVEAAGGANKVVTEYHDRLGGRDFVSDAAFAAAVHEILQHGLDSLVEMPGQIEYGDFFKTSVGHLAHLFEQ